MFTRLLIILLFCCFTNLLPAQSKELMVQGVTPALYVTHTVQPKENWYSVGRLYNISPKEIAPFNGVTMDKPLAIGEQLKVPLTAANFSQNGSSLPDEAFVPVYHIVQEKEWMYRISTNYNKVPVESLEKWNNINRDQAKVGTKLIVGYLKVKKDQSALVTNNPVVPVQSAPPAVPVQSAPPPAPPVLVPPATPAVVRVEEKKPEPVTEVPEKKEEKKSIPAPPPPAPVEEKKIAEKKEEVYKPVVSTVSNNNASGGFFGNMFEESGKSSSGSAGTFKSTSGWQDAKYYALMNNVAVGAIVKVTNPENNKTVFAKVLGQLPEMKESAGLTIRISDAAAAELGVSTTRFPLEIKY